MRNATLRSICLLALFSLAGCGGPDIGAVVGDGTVTVRNADGTATTSGPVGFGNGAALKAETDGVARVSCGGALGPTSTTDGQPGPGIVDFHLDAGAEVKRREGAAFDLVSGATRVHAGPLTSRIVMFHGPVFLEVSTEKNADGIDVRAIAEGESLTIEVTKGEVLLHSPVSTPKDLHFVTLLPGEAATATPGSEPVKRADDD